MALETGLRTLLLAQPSITALVPAQSIGGTTFPSIFNEHPVQGASRPYILISQTDFDPYVCLDGTYGMSSYEIDIDAYANTYSAAVSIAAAVASFLKDYTGPAGNSDTINAVIWESKRSDIIQEAEGRDVQIHIVSQTFQIQVS